MNHPNEHQHPTRVDTHAVRTVAGDGYYRYFAHCEYCDWQGELFVTEAAAEVDGDEHTLAMQGEPA